MTGAAPGSRQPPPPRPAELVRRAGGEGRDQGRVQPRDLDEGRDEDGSWVVELKAEQTQGPHFRHGRRHLVGERPEPQSVFKDRCSSSRSAKIAKARSPTPPVGMRAGVPGRGPFRLESVLNARSYFLNVRALPSRSA